MSARNLLCLLLLPVFLQVMPLSAAEEDKNEKPAAEAVIAPEVVEEAKAVIAGLEAGKKKALTRWLHLLDRGGEDAGAGSSVLAYAPQVPRDLARIFGSAGGTQGGVTFW